MHMLEQICKVFNLLDKKKKGHCKVYSNENSIPWSILKSKDKSYRFLRTKRQEENSCLRDGAVALDWKISGGFFRCLLGAYQTCPIVRTESEARTVPLFVAHSVLEEPRSHSKFEKDSDLQLSERESRKSGEERHRDYNRVKSDWTKMRRSLYRDFVQPVGQQLSVGTCLGLATGYSLRRIGRFALFLIGTEILVLQLMAYKGWVTVHWNKLSRDLIPVLDKSVAESVIDILVYKMPFAAAFCAGLRLAP
ncbi:hypothetical protein GpartN1_g5548.t1 [Galdieria partita]|uniref:FUN14 domain-containing protein 1 n=1 Tax=Galdieria partita TaxID=83374 RepID=A0A9C7Q1E0_9RHOD|nr:hypothetical protein GpartN1_g5548.t1 [Galdieria partita]